MSPLVSNTMCSSRRSKLYYTAPGIITPVGGRPVHRLREDTRPVHRLREDSPLLSQPVHRTAAYRV